MANWRGGRMPYDADADVFQGSAAPWLPNLAAPHLLFQEFLDETQERVPALRCVSVRGLGGPLDTWPERRGNAFTAALQSAAGFAAWPLARFTGSRLLIVLQKR
jgi:hypothetical protein